MQWKLTDFLLLGEIWKENNRKENKIRLAQWAGIIRRMVINVKAPLEWVRYWLGDHLEITITVCSKVHSAFHPFVVGKMGTSITGDKLCMQRDKSGAHAHLPWVSVDAVSYGRSYKKEPSSWFRLLSASRLLLKT